MYQLLAPAAALALGVAVFLSQPNQPQCRCRPSEPCWPSADQWGTFNKSIGGNLARIRPVASVCHGPEYDAAACTDLSSLARDSGWRASNPGESLPVPRKVMQCKANELIPSTKQPCKTGYGRAMVSLRKFAMLSRPRRNLNNPPVTKAGFLCIRQQFNLPLRFSLRSDLPRSTTFVL